MTYDPKARVVAHAEAIAWEEISAAIARYTQRCINEIPRVAILALSPEMRGETVLDVWDTALRQAGMIHSSIERSTPQEDHQS